MAKSKKNTWIRWSADEIKLLKKLFPKGKTRQISDQTGRAFTAVRQKAYDMGLKTRECRLWSADEIKLLQENYLKKNWRELADMFGRSSETIIRKANSIGLRKMKIYVRWKKREDMILKKFYRNSNVIDIEKRIGRSVPSIRARAYLLGLSTPYHIWSKREFNLIKKYYPSQIYCSPLRNMLNYGNIS